MIKEVRKWICFNDGTALEFRMLWTDVSGAREAILSLTLVSVFRIPKVKLDIPDVGWRMVRCYPFVLDTFL